MGDGNANRHLIFRTPLGHAALIYHETPFLLKGVLLPRADKRTLTDLVGKSETGAAGSHRKAVLLSESVREYFGGKPLDIPWERMDMSRFSELQRSVFRAVAHIPYGTVASYGDVARAVGRPRAARFVGNTVASNPFPILIPCHRVVRSDGSLGKFGNAGPELKKKMIELEMAHAKGR